jgi:hypothetical protein
MCQSNYFSFTVDNFELYLFYYDEPSILILLWWAFHVLGLVASYSIMHCTNLIWSYRCTRKPVGFLNNLSTIYASATSDSCYAKHYDQFPMMYFTEMKSFSFNYVCRILCMHNITAKSQWIQNFMWLQLHNKLSLEAYWI